jgi:hypothetical protein
MGPFIALLAETYGVPEGSVTVIARVLREAGWLTTGPRGVNAPEMQPMDAARLTLALMSGQPPSKVLPDLEVLRLLQTEADYRPEGMMSEVDLAPEHTLEDVLTGLFDFCQYPARVNSFGQQFSGITTGPYFSVSVDASTLGAKVTTPDGSAEYSDLTAKAEIEALYARRPMDLKTLERIQQLENRGRGWDSLSTIAGRGMRVVRTITDKEIRKISEAMAGLPHRVTLNAVWAAAR